MTSETVRTDPASPAFYRPDDDGIESRRWPRPVAEACAVARTNDLPIRYPILCKIVSE